MKVSALTHALIQPEIKSCNSGQSSEGTRYKSLEPKISVARLAGSNSLHHRASIRSGCCEGGRIEEENLRTYVDLLRKDIKKDKVSILTEMMDLSPDEASKFWPVYKQYDQELTKLGDERIAFIRMYAENYGSLTDQKVTQIANGLLDVEGRRNALKKKYFQKMSQVLNPKQATKFLQIEHQILLLLDLQVAASLPIVE